MKTETKFRMPKLYATGLLTQAKFLRQCAKEIASAGHPGWGNTCLQAAEVIELTVKDLSETVYG